MFNTLALICVTWWYVMLFHPLHADIQCMGSEAQESPITNVKMNWRKMELSWESSKNFSTYKCTIMDKNMDSVPKKVNSSPCRFPVEQYIALHKGVFFTIEVPNTNISKSCSFIPGGMNGSAIENFSCVIYNISLMNCTWQAGRAAPKDTQYFLYWQYSRHDDAMECELYVKDENGRNMGCRFQNVTIRTAVDAYFLVNGSSNESLIQFYDKYIKLYEVEILTAPLNVTVNCIRDSSGCIITWQQPLTSHRKKGKCFEYEIRIQNKVPAKEHRCSVTVHAHLRLHAAEQYLPHAPKDTKGTGGTRGTYMEMADITHTFRKELSEDNPKEENKDPPVTVRNNIYKFENYNKKKKYILKIRARGKNCLISSDWGEWSEPIEFGQGKDYFIFVILFLIALGTISVTLLPYCLFKRYCSFKSIFSPIPQPRDKFNASNGEDTQTEYVNLPKKSCREEITIVEEMT